ncbi:magnesium transporter CorA family protein [Ketobacter sp.]
MIRAKCMKNGVITTGDSGLVQQWQDQGEGFLWLDMAGEDLRKEAQLLLSLGCHQLAIQDTQRPRHPPKFEDFESNTFIIYRGFEKFDQEIVVEHVQVAYFVGKNFVITRRSGQSFGVEAMWNAEADLMRYMAEPALLCTRIINTSLSGYIDRVLDLEDVITLMEDQMLDRPTDTLMQQLVLYRSRLRKLNRIFRYHEKVFGELLRESTEVMNMEDSGLYHSTQDVFDKCERLSSLGQLFYEQCGDLIDGYLSLTSHQLNKTMQALTVITAIFVPLGLLSGIYGMNFDHMPELHSTYGYYILLSVMVTVAITLLLFFRRRGWL